MIQIVVCCIHYNLSALTLTIKPKDSKLLNSFMRCNCSTRFQAVGRDCVLENLMVEVFRALSSYLIILRKIQLDKDIELLLN